VCCARGFPRCAKRSRERVDAEHSLIVSQILAHIPFLDEAIHQLSDEIEQRIAPFTASATC
jgi:hypothetical protein